MSNSNLVVYTKISPNRNAGRAGTYNPSGKIDKITIHHMAGNLSIETCGNVFASSAQGASANYGIGSDGRVGMYVEEKDRSWCSSSRANDYHAVTIEVANDGGAPDWHVSDKAFNALIDLCVDICKRNGFRLNYTGDASGSLTRHNMFAATACPGPYLQGRFAEIAQLVNDRLDGKTETGAAGTYTVVKGDSPWSIAEKVLGSGSKYKELMACNGLAENATIYAGQVLKIPGTAAETPAKPTGYPEPTRNIANYTEGDDVGWVQTKLQALGYDPGDIDCKYGDKGEAAVRQLQRDYGLSVDGIVGANTRKALKGELKKVANPYRKPTQVIYLGDWGDGIKWVQWHLERKGYDIGASGIDGQYGSGTQAAVKRFQADHGLTVDGIVGEKTRAALEA